MSYTSIEESLDQSQPLELYTFIRDGQVYRYTSNGFDYSYESFLFLSYPMDRSEVSQSVDKASSSMSIDMTKSVPMLAPYYGSPPTGVTTVLVQRIHMGLVGAEIIFHGRITSVEFVDSVKAKVNCEPVFTALKRPVMTRRFQVSCTYVLYGPQCKADQSSKAVPAILIGATGTVLTAGVFGLKPDHYFDGGFVTFADASNTQVRSIRSHVGTNLTINLPFVGIKATSNVVAYPGCAHTIDVCSSKFDNAVNYGGQPYQAPKNPMAKIPIY